MYMNNFLPLYGALLITGVTHRIDCRCQESCPVPISPAYYPDSVMLTSRSSKSKLTLSFW